VLLRLGFVGRLSGVYICIVDFQKVSTLASDFVDFVFQFIRIFIRRKLHLTVERTFFIALANY